MSRQYPTRRDRALDLYADSMARAAVSIENAALQQQIDAHLRAGCDRCSIIDCAEVREWKLQMHENATGVPRGRA